MPRQQVAYLDEQSLNNSAYIYIYSYSATDHKKSQFHFLVPFLFHLQKP